MLALQFMTRLPLPAVAATSRDFGMAIRWCPMVGVIVGGAVAGAGWLGALRDPALGALMALLAWVGITGALHLDGLGDIADAAGAVHANPDRLRAVLADPHIGSFGVSAIVLQMLSKLVLLGLAVRAQAFVSLGLIAMLGRIGPLAWARFLPPLHEGIGTLFRKGATLRALVAWLTGWSVLAAAIEPSLLFALPALPLWTLWLRARIGGISGDGHGAGIELVETAALVVLVVAR